MNLNTRSPDAASFHAPAVGPNGTFDRLTKSSLPVMPLFLGSPEKQLENPSRCGGTGAGDPAERAFLRRVTQPDPGRHPDEDAAAGEGVLEKSPYSPAVVIVATWPPVAAAASRAAGQAIGLSKSPAL